MEQDILDYYKNKGVSAANISDLIKTYNMVDTEWWLRSAWLDNSNCFFGVGTLGECNCVYSSSNIGVSPAFRLG